MSHSYKKNLLNKVIFQLNYIPIESINNELNADLILYIENKIGVKIKETKNQILNVNFDDKQSSSNYVSQWNYLGKPLSVTINNSFIQIITTEYTHYHEFHPIVIDIFNEFHKKYKPIISRIALRYINIIYFKDGGTYEFNKFINDALLNPTLFFKDEGLTRSIGSMIISDDNGIKINFIYGFHNTEFPNKINKREFVLDFDCFTAYDGSTDKIDEVLQKLRLKVNHLFEKSIENKLRNYLNEIN